MTEVNELFEGWAEHPPTNLLLNAIVEGFGGGSKKPQKTEAGINSPEMNAAMAHMQKAALSEIQAKAGNSLPVTKGIDKGLPRSAPVFDEEALRARNLERAKGFKKGDDLNVGK